MICLNCGCKVNLGAKFCSNCGFPTKLSDENTSGEINIIRESKVFGFAIPFTVYIDDSQLGTLKNGTTLTSKVSYGFHEIKLTSTEKAVIEEININENQKSASIYIAPKIGIITARPSIKKIEYGN